MGTRGRKQNPNWFHCFLDEERKGCAEKTYHRSKEAYDEIVAVPPCAVSLSAICRE